MEFCNVVYIFMILCFAGELRDVLVACQPGGGSSNGTVIDHNPEFDDDSVHGVHILPYAAVSSDNDGLPPPTELDDRNRIAKAAGAREGDKAGLPAVFELFKDENSPQKRTVNAYTYREPGGDFVLLEKTAESKYNRITFKTFLTHEEVAALEGGQQGGEGAADD